MKENNPTYEELLKENLLLKQKLKKEPEEKYRFLIENILDVVWIIDIESLKLTFISPSIEKLTGYTVEESMLRKIEDTFTNKSIKEVEEKIREGLTKFVKTGEKEVYTDEFEQVCKNGSTVWTEVITYFRINPENNRLEVIGTTRDINKRKLVEEKSRLAEQKYKILIENAPGAISLIGIDRKYKYISNAVKKFGYTEEEFLKLDPAEITHPDDLPLLGKIVQEVIQEPSKVLTVKYRCKHKNGSWIWIENTFSNMLNDPEINALVINTRDIHDEKLAEIKLKESEEKFSKIFQSSPDILILTQLNGGKILDVNERCLEVTKHKLNEIIGRTTLEINLWANSANREEYVYLLNKSGFVRNLEYDFLLKSGERRNALLSANILTINNEKCVLGTIRDITESKKIQKRLIKSEYMLKEAQSIAKLGYWEIDLLNNNILWSDENYNILGIDKSESEPSYEEFIKAIHPEDRDFVTETYASSVKTKKPYDIVHRLLMKDGSVKYVHEKGHTDYDQSGNPKNSIGTIQDITERVIIEKEIKQLNQNLELKVKERTEELEEANKELESFAYSISHDLKAPLRHIDGFSGLLKNIIEHPTDETERLLTKIRQASSKMAIMIDDLLKFSRLGRKSLEKTDVDLNILLKQVIETLKPDTENRKIEFKVGNLPVIKGDYGLLHVVFENLISNSIKFTSKKDNAIIEIDKCKDHDKNCIVFVRDNGAGFDMAYADKLFGVFQRLHSENDFHGTGIGLANVKKIIKRHGGTIHAEAEVDKGATFYLSLEKNKPDKEISLF